MLNYIAQMLKRNNFNNVQIGRQKSNLITAAETMNIIIIVGVY